MGCKLSQSNAIPATRFFKFYLLGNKRPKATYKLQYRPAIYNDCCARQCIQYVKKPVYKLRKIPFTVQ